MTNVIHNDDGSVESVDNTHTLVAMLIFATALCFNLNAALWSLQSSRYRLNLQVAYISAVAAWTHYEMYVSKDWYVSVTGTTSVGLCKLNAPVEQ